MLTVGASEAETHPAELLERVAEGEEVLITRHGKAVARLGP
jgi:prevent-host-death family protein